jgi:hypothetical protein
LDTKILTGKHERKIPLRKSGHKPHYTVRMDFKEREYQNVDWSYLTEDKIQWQALMRASW